MGKRATLYDINKMRELYPTKDDKKKEFQKKKLEHSNNNKKANGSGEKDKSA